MDVNKRDQIDTEYKEQAIKFYKEQLVLIEDQKQYGKTIKCATIVTAIATLVMAIAMIIQCWIMVNTSELQKRSSISNTPPSQQQTQSPPAKQP